MSLTEMPEPVPGEGEVLAFSPARSAARTCTARARRSSPRRCGRPTGRTCSTSADRPSSATSSSAGSSRTDPAEPFLGSSGPEPPGGHAERMVLSEALLLEVPGHVPTEQAALTKPLAVACHAVDRAGLRPDDVPLVVGCGPIGLAIITPLRMWSVGPIVAVDFSVERRRLAESLGADPVVDPAQNSPYEAWTRAPAPRRLADRGFRVRRGVDERPSPMPSANGRSLWRRRPPTAGRIGSGAPSPGRRPRRPGRRLWGERQRRRLRHRRQRSVRGSVSWCR